MLVRVRRGDEIIQESDTANGTRTYKTDSRGRRKETPIEYSDRKRFEHFRINIKRVPVVEEETTQSISKMTTTDTAVKVNEQIKHDYDSALFNKAFTLDDVPSLDESYKSTIVVKNHRGTTVVDERDDHKTEDAIRDEVERVRKVVVSVSEEEPDHEEEEEYDKRYDETDYSESDRDLEDEDVDNESEDADEDSEYEDADFETEEDDFAVADDNPFEDDPDLRDRVEEMIKIIPRGEDINESIDDF